MTRPGTFLERLSPQTKSRMADIGIILGFLLLYFMLTARDFISGRYYFPGDTYYFWSLDYLIFHSVKVWNSLPWWDPSSYGGYPLYYQFISGIANHLGPYSLPSLILFKLLSFFRDMDINAYIAFHRTIYVMGLNMTAVYLICKQSVKTRTAAAFGLLLFSFSYFQLLNYHDYYMCEAMVAPLFLVYGLLRYNNNRTPSNLCLLAGLAAMMMSSLSNAAVMSAAFWVTVVFFLSAIFCQGLAVSAVTNMKILWGNVKGKVLVIAAAALMISGAVTAVLPIHYNAGHVLRYRGGTIDYKSSAGITNTPIPVENSENWTFASSWNPSPELHSKFLGYALHGHGYRYIGLATLALMAAALVFGAGNPYVWIFSLTALICNTYLIGTSTNAFYRIFLDYSDIVRNTRNMASVFPRGGALLFLIVLAAMGLDYLIRRDEAQWSGRRAKILGFVIKLLFAIGAIITAGVMFTPQPDGASRAPLFHIGLYTLIFAGLAYGLLYSRKPQERKLLVLTLFICAFLDITAAFSAHLDYSDGNPVGNRYGRISVLDKTVIGPVSYTSTIMGPIPSNLSFGPVTKESENWFPSNYSGACQNPWLIMWGIKEWLILATGQNQQAFLPNWNPSTFKMTRHPMFQFFTNGYYRPIDDISLADTDTSISHTSPMFFLHDRNAVKTGLPKEFSTDIKILKYQPGNVIVSFHSPQDGFMLYLDNNDRFWTARINGQEAAVIPANFAFKAVAIKAGDNTVEWNYNPWPMKYSYIIYYILLAAFIAALAAYRKRTLQTPSAL